MSLGDRIRQARRDAGLTQKELAARLGTTESFVSQYETGHRIPKYNKVEKMADILGVTPEYLLHGEECSALGDRIKQARLAAGMTQEELAGDIGTAVITIRQYEADRREPSIATLRRLASALNLPSAAYFLDPADGALPGPDRPTADTDCLLFIAEQLEIIAQGIRQRVKTKEETT